MKSGNVSLEANSHHDKIHKTEAAHLLDSRHVPMDHKIMAERGALGKQLIESFSHSADEPAYNYQNNLESKFYKFIGGNGRFQWMVFVLSMLTQFFIQFPITLLSFEGAGPTAVCPTNKENTEFDACFEPEACAMIAKGRPARLIIDDNWTKQYDMMCDKEPIRNFYKSIFMLICNAVSLLVLQTADLFGRRTCMIVSFIVCTGGAALTYFVDHFGAKIVFNGIAYSGMTTYGCLFTFYLSEIVDPTYFLYKYIVAGWIVAFPAGSAAFCAITYYRKDAKFLTLVSFLGVGISTFLTCLVIPESPLYVLAKKSTQQFVNSCKTIRTINALPHDQPKEEELVVEAEKYKSELAVERSREEAIDKEHLRGHEISAIFTNKLFLFQVIGLTFIQGVFLSVFFGSNFNMEEMGPSSIAFNGIVTGLTQMVSGILMGIALHRLSRRKWLLSFQSITLVACILLVTINKMHRTPFTEIIEWILASWIINPIQNASFIPLNHYNSELYPVELRGTANSISNFVGTIIAMGSLFLSSFGKSLGLHPMVGSCAVALISLPLTFFLRETV